MANSYNPFNSSLGFGRSFIDWMNDYVIDSGNEIAKLENDISALTTNGDRLLAQSEHFDTVDAKLTLHSQKLGELEAGSQDNEVILARHGYPSLSAFLESLADNQAQYSIRTAHKDGHKKGGNDELNIYELKNGDVVQQQMANMQKNAVGKWRDVVAYYGVQKRVVGNASALIQQAIDECAPLDITVVIPEGEYYMEKYLVARKGLKLIVNKNATLYRYHNDAMLMNGDRGGALGNDDIFIDGGTWDLRGHLLGYDGSGFAFGYAKNITLRNATVLNVNYSHGIEIAGVENGYIEYCTFNGFIDTTGTRGYAESIQVESGIPGGFPYFGNGDNVNCKDIYITGCTAGASEVAGTWNVGIGTHSSPTVTVAQGVYIKDCDYRKVKTTGIVANGYTGLQVERTKIEAANGIYIYHDQATKTNFVIRDCDIKAINGAAVMVNGVSVGTIERNTLNGYANAISIVKSKEIDIINKNDLTAQTNDAITITDTCSDISVHRNIIRKAGRHGINSYQNITHLNFYGNEIIDVTQNAFNLQGASVVGVIIEANKIKDTTLNFVLSASSAISAMIFTKNYYPASISTPISSTALNSDTTGNKTF